ncbi:hypothetical protein [Prolixibacter sp. NT017]|uniref:hypothetical protein n=1 Tax=Prolixibacter sp. NT017 TaxID=2652390 RepID=UPI00128569A6|nr:hypothetical protein [Prolixibacter sp. NT017]GET26293.1 hypothetical protein NT017_26220 [Prolixibacter sp. NT017]
MKQSILFTALPNGRTSQNGQDYLRLSLAIAIQLAGSGKLKLKDFPDVLKWHDELNAMQFTLNMDGKESVIQPVQDKLDPSLWGDLFHGDIKVESYKKEDYTLSRIHSYQVASMKTFLLKTYTQFGTKSPEKVVRGKVLLENTEVKNIGRFRPLQETQIRQFQRQPITNIRPMVTRELVKNNTLEEDHSKLLSARNYKELKLQAKVPAYNFVQLRDFHKYKMKMLQAPLLKIEKPEFEFHDILAALGSYPQLQRKFGLVLDFLVPVPENVAPESTLKIYPSVTDWEVETEISTPRTAYRLTSDGFYAREKNDTFLHNGFVKINTPEFSANQIDTDGTAVQLSEMVDNQIEKNSIRQIQVTEQNQQIERMTITNLALNLAHEKDEEEDEEGMPPMRSAGIGIIKNDIDVFVDHRFQITQKLQADFSATHYRKREHNIIAPEEILYAEDVTLGYRMDIAYSEQPDKWYSLHRKQDRVNYYDENNNPTEISDIEPDEGFLQMAASQDPENPDDFFVSETLFRWEGWSLSVPRPGLAINEADDSSPDKSHDYVHRTMADEQKKFAFDPTLNFKLNVQSEIIPGTLPRLRFGKSYNIRVRTVDLTGNSVALKSETDSPNKCIISGFVYQRYEPVSNPLLLLANALRQGETPESLVIRSNYDQTAEAYEQAEGTGNGTTARHLLPPENSQLMAETHGRFDKAFDGNPDAAREMYQLIVGREKSPEVMADGKDKIYSESEASIQYIPDPAAAGVAVFLADGYEKTHEKTFDPRYFSFFSSSELNPTNNAEGEGDWLKYRSLRIQLAEGDFGATWSSGDRMLTVRLPKGYRLKLKFTSFWRSTDLQSLSGVWKMLKEESPGDQKLKQLAFTGRHWMLSPGRELELVHAVQQPVEEPKIDVIQPARDFGSTDADLNTKLKIHARSTEEMYVEAHWKDMDDNPLLTEPKEVDANSQLDQFVVGYHESEKQFGYISTAKEKPQMKLRMAGPMIKKIEPDQKPVQLFHMKPDVTFKTITYRGFVLAIPPLVHRFNDTKHRWVDYRPVGTSRYAEMFVCESDETPKPVKREGPWFEKVNILSTARPAIPKVEYVLPLMHWEKSDGNKVMIHKRNGGGLRVYMDRPWFSSGEGEKLAILLMPQGNKDKTAMMRATQRYNPNFTMWGIDPIHPSTQPDKTGPLPDDFGFNAETVRNLEHPGVKNIRTDAAIYPVRFDKQRKKWYADISISTQRMYFPFIRLILARYQENSLREGNHDVCLSEPVTADFMQLLPDRRTHIEFNNDTNNSRFRITISGLVSHVYPNHPGSYFEITFIDPELAQPIDAILDDDRTDKTLSRYNYTIAVSEKNVNNGYFRLVKDFNLPGKYRSTPFEIIIREYERSGEQLKTTLRQRGDGLPPNNEPRLVYADVFKINVKK